MATTKAAIEAHWLASDLGDTDAEHAIYAVDAELEYPQSGERFRGRATIAAQRSQHPADRRFAVLRIVGEGNLWVSECTISYDGVPTFSVSIMEFLDQQVIHETQYFADPFSVPEWRSALSDTSGARSKR
ncbi:nuclear transport factor 2 family protein [Marmoricola sp. URHB0036]|uniref:nuclear transport factor 2 family protein n=1 Tax=Marmoricola sp. URHB0036 TaxID=1298863 RepID=UPI000481872A|nr:nuclear transport factor 2 family protein [Marmoricola sp. URHB0036]